MTTHSIDVKVLAEAPRYLARCSCGWGRWVYQQSVLDADAAVHLAGAVAA